MLIETILVRVPCAVDGKRLSAGFGHAVFRIALTVTLLPEPGIAEALKLASSTPASINRLSESIVILVSFVVVLFLIVRVRGYQ